jgi:phosphopantetheine--protein transferase-like protein
MTDQAKIRSVVARFFNVPEAVVTDNFAFPPERLNASIGRATFHAALKRMGGADLPAAFTAKTFGDLFGQEVATAPAGTSVVAVSETPAAAESSSAFGLGVGIDIESFDQLPAATDFWTEPFYVENFTAAEIAHCQRQPDPRASFCGLWCAKEAVRKCSPEFFGLRPLELEIQHDVNGRPFLTIVRENRRVVKPAYDLSISHAHGMGAAVCVAREGKAAMPEDTAVTHREPPHSNGRFLAWLGLGLGLLNLLLWLLFAGKK